LLRLVRETGLEEVIDVPGFVPTEVVGDLLARAMCVLLPSRREGYGMIVIEAAARGTPSIVVAGPDNAAVELLAEGENGLIAASASDEELAAAIVGVHEAGPALRDATAAWFVRNVAVRSLGASVAVTLDAYRRRAVARANGGASTEPGRTGTGLISTDAGPSDDQPMAAGVPARRS
jgi:glycosyltransferase involved in cell wall biosynthesis